MILRLILLTVNEIRRLHAVFNRPVHPPEHHERWSHWRRRHQLRASRCHYRRRRIKEGLSQREIAKMLGISKTTVNGILKRQGRRASGSDTPGP